MRTTHLQLALGTWHIDDTLPAAHPRAKGKLDMNRVSLRDIL